MVVNKSLGWRKILAFLLTPTVIVFSGLPTLVEAQPRPKQQVSISFPRGRDRGAPARSFGTGSRGPICDDELVRPPLTALMPKNNVGTSVGPNPTVYLYVPETSDKQAEFVLVDLTNRRFLYETTFQLSGTPGIIKLTLPKTVELKPGSHYQWHFGVICDPQDQSKNKVLQGFLERTTLSREQEVQLEEADEPLEQAKVYATAGVWSETLTIIAQLRESNPKAWEELLNSVDLEEIAPNPIFDCCKLDNQAHK